MAHSSQLIGWRRSYENIAHAVYFSSDRTDGRKKAPKPNYTVGVVRESSQDWQCAPWSSNWYRAWRYPFARRRLSSSMSRLGKFEPSAYWTSRCSGQSWWFAGFKEIQKGSSCSYPEWQCTSLYPLRAASGTFSAMGNSHVATPRTDVLIADCSGDTTTHHRRWCDPGYCCLQTPISSIGPDNLAYGVPYVPVWTFVGSTWRHLCVIPTLSPSFPTHWSRYSAPHTQSPSINPPIRADELIETPSFRGVTAVHGRPERGLSFTSLSPLLKRATPPPHCANIHCLVSVHVQQASMDIIGCKVFRMEVFSYTLLFHMHLNDRHHFVKLSLCCHLSHGKKLKRILEEGSTCTAIGSTSASDLVGQHNKIGALISDRHS